MINQIPGWRKSVKNLRWLCYFFFPCLFIGFFLFSCYREKKHNLTELHKNVHRNTKDTEYVYMYLFGKDCRPSLGDQCGD